MDPVVFSLGPGSGGFSPVDSLAHPTSSHCAAPLFGFALGLGVGSPEEFLGEEALLPAVSLAVGVILFEGGLTLRFQEIQETGAVVLRLVTIGLLVTWGATLLAAHWLLDFSWPMATLLGALLTVSGPTVVLPLLRQVRPTGRVGSVIKWEGIVNDPIGAVLAALVFEVVAHGSGGGLARESAWMLAKSAAIGILFGGITAMLIIQMLKHYLAPDYLQNPLVLAIVVTVFAGSNYLQSESGLVTVTVLGLLLANQSVGLSSMWSSSKKPTRALDLGAVYRALLARTYWLGAARKNRLGWLRLCRFVGAGGSTSSYVYVDSRQRADLPRTTTAGLDSPAWNCRGCGCFFVCDRTL